MFQYGGLADDEEDGEEVAGNRIKVEGMGKVSSIAA